MLAEKTFRTVEMYNADAVIAESSGCHQGGVKFSSPLNNLRHYHVCQPGLPPCLAHDVFEGVIAFDMVLLIKHYISKKWFTLEYLNHQIKTFPYGAEERMCMPCLVKNSYTKLNGNASQNWSMLRLFPMFVWDKIQDCDDMAWQMLLALHQIVQLLCASAISVESVCYLNMRIKEYIRF